MSIEIIESVVPYLLSKDQLVNVTVMNNGSVEIDSLAKYSHGLDGIRKISKHIYMDKSGGIHEYKATANRAQSPESVRNSFKKVRRLIKNNFCGSSNELIITLTYGEHYMLIEKGLINKKQASSALLAYRKHGKKNIHHSVGYFCVKKGYITYGQLDDICDEMRDAKEFYNNMRKFIARFRYKYEKVYGKAEYIYVKEPQGRRNNHAWHAHLLVKFTEYKGSVFIDNEMELEPLWRLGFTYCEYIDDVNITASYLGHDKYDRMGLYPSGVKVYVSSKGMIYPETINKMRLGDAQTLINGKELVL